MAGTINIKALSDRVLQRQQMERNPEQQTEQAKKGRNDGRNGIEQGMEREMSSPGINPMTTCLHGKKCEHLDCYPGERPGCLKAMDWIFDLKECPLKMWGPISQALDVKPEGGKKLNDVSGC